RHCRSRGRNRRSAPAQRTEWTRWLRGRSGRKELRSWRISSSTFSCRAQFVLIGCPHDGRARLNDLGTRRSCEVHNDERGTNRALKRLECACPELHRLRRLVAFPDVLPRELADESLDL